MGWYYGIRLHMITDIDGLPLSLGFTTTKTGEREWLKTRANTIFKDNKMLFVADKGYLGKDYQQDILSSGNYILTGIKPSKTNKLPLADWQLHLFKLRARIETCFGKLKNNYNLVSTKARTPFGFCFNWVMAVFSFLIGIK
jgi:Transposase DDE domain